MKKKKLVTICAILMTLCFVLVGCASSGGGTAQQEAKNPTEALDHFLTDIKSGNYESASTYLKEGNRLFRIFAAKDGESVPMLDDVYKKLMNQMGDFTYTLEEGQVPSNVIVKIQSNDCSSSIQKAMSEAIRSQTQNGGNDFENIAGWLSAGLDNAEPTGEQEYRWVVTEKSGSYHMDHTSYGDIDMLNAITCGFYDYTKLTMTTCTGSEDGLEYTDYIAALGDTVIGYIETVTATPDHELTEEEKTLLQQEFFAGFENLAGVYVGAQFNEDGTATMSMGIDFNVARPTVLYDLGIVSGKYISNGTSNLSLASTVKSFQETGMVCETLPQYETSDK